MQHGIRSGIQDDVLFEGCKMDDAAAVSKGWNSPGNPFFGLRENFL